MGDPGIDRKVINFMLKWVLRIQDMKMWIALKLLSIEQLS
jgi:hypothetical protein